jgi:hypothetical protein
VTTLRRTAALVLIALATVLGLTVGTAQAAFTDNATMATLTVGTTTVAAPTGLSTAGTYCSTVTTYYNGVASTTTTLHAQLSWKASGTRGLSGYRVTAWFPDGSSYPVGDVGTSTSVAMDVDGSYASQNIRVTVMTLTSYGWTAESARSAALTC